MPAFAAIRPKAARTAGLAATFCALAAAPVARAAEPDGANGSRLYAGVAVLALDFVDSHEGVTFDDVSTGFGVYGGFRLHDRLALELSYDAADAIDVRDIAGSGIVRLDIETERRTTTFSVVREVSLKELFEWPRDWRLYGTAGIYDSDLRRTVTALNTNTRRSVRDSDTGLLIGAGVLYALGHVELRGYLLSGGDAREFGAAVQFRF